MAGVHDNNHTLGAVFRHGGHIQRRAELGTVPGSVAGLSGREPVLLAGQPGTVLRGAYDSYLVVLRDDLD